MRHQNGEGPDHRGGGVEARELEQLERRLEVLAIAETSTRQEHAVRAEIIGEDRCEAENLSARGPSLVLALCRKLIEAGFDPGRPPHVYRGAVPALSIRSIAAGARLTVKERPFGPVSESWKPLPTPPCGAAHASN